MYMSPFICRCAFAMYTYLWGGHVLELKTVLGTSK